jgi:hypothetical protein
MMFFVQSSCEAVAPDSAETPNKRFGITQAKTRVRESTR